MPQLGVANETVRAQHQVETKHPPGLYMLSIVQVLERFSYYGMRALLVLYLTTEYIKGGFGIDKSTATLIYGWFTGLVYFTPMIGGYLADKFIGKRNGVLLGALSIALGQVMLFLNQTLFCLYGGLVLLIIGNGLYKPNMTALVGELYPDGDSRKDAAYSIFYMAINVGAFFAPLICGGIAESLFAVKQGETIVQFGFRYGFLAAGIGMIIGHLIFWLTANKYLGNIDKQQEKKTDNGKPAVVSQPLTTKERERVWVIFILAAFVVFFWAGFEQAGSTLTLYTKDFINRSVGSFEVPVSWFQSFNPIFCVILGPIAAWVWIRLSKRPQGDLSIPVKMGLGMIFLGIGYLLMVGAVFERGQSTDIMLKANILWLVGAYFLHTVGEMCLSPIGLAMVSHIAPKKYLSLLMGVWLLSSFVANVLGGYVGSAFETYGHLQIFGGIAGFTILLGFMLFALNKRLVAMMK